MDVTTQQALIERIVAHRAAGRGTDVAPTVMRVPVTAYTDVDAVREETVRARRLYEKHGWPVIDVTRRSVEETAAAIVNLLSGGRGQVEVLG